MYSKIKIAGHPVHPMLVPFPIAFYTATLFCFIIYAFNADPFWFRAGIASNVAGVAMAIIAASMGFLDWLLGIPSGTRAKVDGIIHMSFNSVALVLFVISLGLNAGQWSAAAPVMRLAIILPLLGVVSTVSAGFFGWKLVQTHHVGVEFSQSEEACITTASTFEHRKAA